MQPAIGCDRWLPGSVDPIGGNVADRYKIVRMFFNSDKFPSKAIHHGLTLEEAQAHCKDPETSSKTCTKSAGKRRTRVCGPWFDGYERE